MKLRTHGAVLRPHAYEIFTIANLVAGAAFLAAHGADVMITNLPRSLVVFGSGLLTYLLGGMALRLTGGLLFGRTRGYLRHIRRWTWWLETVRLLLFGTVATHIYVHLKVAMPRATSWNADALLWHVDSLLFFGHAPTVFLLEAFRADAFLTFVDFTYQRLFQWTIHIAFAIALSSPSLRMRLAVVGGKAVLWIVGAWLYYSLPSMGPAYRFPEFWTSVAAQMPQTREMLTALYSNYLVVMGARPGTVQVLYGIGAFPSLHVAYQTFVALWLRRFSRAAGAVAMAAAVIVFFGSMITGWHYLVDSLAGLVLAWLSYRALFRFHRLDRWIALFRVVRRRFPPTPRRLLRPVERAFGLW